MPYRDRHIRIQHRFIVLEDSQRRVRMRVYMRHRHVRIRRVWVGDTREFPTADI